MGNFRLNIKHLHLVIFSIIVPLSIYINNRDQLLLSDVILTLFFALGSALILFWLLSILIGNNNKASVLTTIFWILFYSFGQLRHIIRMALVRAGNFAYVEPLVGSDFAQAVWLSGWIVLLGFVAILITKSKTIILTLNSWLNITGLATILMVSSNLVFVGNARLSDNAMAAFTKKQINSKVFSVDSLAAWKQTENLPDVYYIIVDGYGRSDVLEEIYNFDNQDLLDFLVAQGFYVAEESNANYAWTELSIASSLNYSYLDDIPETFGDELRDTYPLQVMIEHNLVSQVLRDFGYHIVTFEDEYWITDIETADHYLSSHPFKMNPFQVEVINSTPVSVVTNLFDLKDHYDLHREQVNFIFDNLANLTSMDGPKFVFAHILAPHPPFVFSAEGKSIQPDRAYSMMDGSAYFEVASIDEYYQGYRGQAQYISQRIKNLVSEILANSTEPPIILIQSDHGPGLGLNWYSKEDTNIKERFAILNAYYFPDENYSKLYSGISPVNSFRAILNQYFGTEYDMVEDRSFFTTENRPYSFMEVYPPGSIQGTGH